MRRALGAAAALALLGAAALASGAVSGPQPARAAECVPVQHSKTVVKRKKVRRHGKLVKVKRKRVVHWTTCEPVPAPATCAEPSSSLGVTSRDTTGSSFTLSRDCVSAGDVGIELNNLGEDPHNLYLRPGTAYGDGTPTYRLPGAEPFEVPSLAQASGDFQLAPGSWYLWCNLGSHRAQGMEAVLQVR